MAGTRLSVLSVFSVVKDKACGARHAGGAHTRAAFFLGPGLRRDERVLGVRHATYCVTRPHR
jgi:hypothetical protein